MALNIKEAETDALVRELATLTDESITVAIRTAVRERLDRLHRGASPVRESLLQGYIERARSRASLDERTEDEILGYDQDGLPQ